MSNIVRNEMIFHKKYANKIIKLPEMEKDYANGKIDFNLIMPMQEKNANHLLVIDCDENYKVVFDTKTEPPKKWLETLCNMGVDFNLKWYQDDIFSFKEYAGEFVSKDGKLTDCGIVNVREYEEEYEEESKDVER